MRLEKLISSQGKYSRRDVKSFAKKGLIIVNGKPIKDAGMNVDESCDEITLNGEKFEYKEHVYIMLNKPQGVVSASDDKKQKTVIDLVPEELLRPGLFPAGRLDSDTTGFVLITDDGDFAHRILSPKHHVDKTYKVTLADSLSDEDVQAIEEGIILKDETECLPAKIKMLGERELEIKICEGKYHQIKRMFAARGNKVEKLQRIQMGGLPLDPNLSLGACRELTKNEICIIEQNK